MKADAPRAHAFISHAHHDADNVIKLQAALEAAGVPVWRDIEQISPGEDWRIKIQQAISGNALVFLACFSRAGLAERRSGQNEALALAVDEVRQRAIGVPWLIPVRLDECEVPDLPLGAGRTLKSIRSADLFGSQRADELARLVSTVTGLVGSRSEPGSDSAPATVGSRELSEPRGRAGANIFQSPRASRYIHFTGRASLLARLAAVRPGEPTVVLQAVTGLGGIGKTELVNEHAHRHRRDFNIVYTIRAGSEATRQSDFQALAGEIGLSQAWDGLVARVLRWLELPSSDGWMLIFDNADHLPSVAPYLPEGSGHVLITSRDNVWRQRADVIDVDVWEPSESVAFLQSRLGSDQAWQAEGASQLAEMLGHFPLALEQAAGYVERTGVSCLDYVRLYRENSRNFLNEDAPAVLGYDQVIGGTWDVTFRAIEDEWPQALELLRLCAFLAPEALPEAVFRQGAECLPSELGGLISDPKMLNDALGLLSRYRLVRRYGDRLSMHRLVQHVVRITAPDSGRALANAGVRLVSSLLPVTEEGSFGGAALSASVMLPHALAAAAHGLAVGSEPELAERLLLRAGDYMGQRAQLVGAEAAVIDAVTITEQIHGQGTPEMARTLLTLGRLLLAREALAAARACFERALPVIKGVYGPSSGEAVEVLNDLAATLMRQGDLSGAQALLRQTGLIDDPEERHER